MKRTIVATLFFMLAMPLAAETPSLFGFSLGMSQEQVIEVINSEYAGLKYNVSEEEINFSPDESLYILRFNTVNQLIEIKAYTSTPQPELLKIMKASLGEPERLPMMYRWSLYNGLYEASLLANTATLKKSSAE